MYFSVSCSPLRNNNGPSRSVLAFPLAQITPQLVTDLERVTFFLDVFQEILLLLIWPSNPSNPVLECNLHFACSKISVFPFMKPYVNCSDMPTSLTQFVTECYKVLVLNLGNNSVILHLLFSVVVQTSWCC